MNAVFLIALKYNDCLNLHAKQMGFSNIYFEIWDLNLSHHDLKYIENSESDKNMQSILQMGLACLKHYLQRKWLVIQYLLKIVTPIKGYLYAEKPVIRHNSSNVYLLKSWISATFVSNREINVLNPGKPLKRYCYKYSGYLIGMNSTVCNSINWIPICPKSLTNPRILVDI